MKLSKSYLEGITITSQLSGKPKQKVGVAVLALSIIPVGFYAASILLVWLYDGGWVSSFALWTASLLLFIPVFWLSPLAIPSLMVMIGSCYVARRLYMSANSPFESKTSTTAFPSKAVSKGWKRISLSAFSIVMIVLLLSFFYFTFTEDYDSVQSIVVSMAVQSRLSSINSQQVNFTVFIYMNTLHPATEATKIIGATFTLTVDSQPAGTVAMPFDSQVGGWTTRDIAYDAHFNMTGSSAQVVLDHNPNDVVLTVQFFEEGLLHHQEISDTLSSSYQSST